MQQTVLSTQNLSKSYGKIQALNNVSIDVPQGSIYGILGPNGSGKSTLLGLVTGILSANSGSYSYFEAGADDAMRKQMGVLLETPNFYHYLSAVDNLKIVAQIKGSGENNIDHVLKLVNLYERRNSKFSTYSLGMKQRLAIASALLANPSLLILDEPTNGLDPAGIAEIRQLIKDIAAQGKTVLMASHLLDEVEKVCTNVAILKKGNLIVSGSVGSVMQQQSVVVISAADLQKLAQIIKQMPDVDKIVNTGDSLELSFKNKMPALETINSFGFNNGMVLSQLREKAMSLENIFFELTNNKN